jgi:hypothetical protein
VVHGFADKKSIRCFSVILSSLQGLLFGRDTTC